MSANGAPAPRAVTPLPVQPVLEYATPDADGLPDVVPEAEALIAQGRPPNAIRRHFRNADQAVRYFAKSMSRRHSAEALGDACAGCGGDGRAFAVQLQWAAAAAARFLEFRVTTHEATTTFRTIHPVCQACGDLWLARTPRFAVTLKWLGYAQSALAFGYVFFLILTVAPVLRTYVPIPRMRGSWAVAWFLGAVLLLALIRVGFRLAWRLRLPRALKRLMPRGVTLGGVTAVFSREGGTLRSLTY